MATSAASYRRSSNLDRDPRDLSPVPVTAAPRSRLGLVSPDLITAEHICRDLEELCEMGILEAFVDMYGIVRYRPTEGISQ